MEKNGAVAAGVTSCDMCAEKAVVFAGNGAFCQRHKSTGEKQASEQHLPLKSIAPQMEPKHTH